jgi:hypothetical protein
MNRRVIATPQEFRDRAGPFLEEREAENNLILGNLTRLLEGGPVAASAPGEPVFLCTVEEDGKVIAAAMRTPPYNLVLTRAPAIAVAVVADHIARQRMTLPGIMGPEETAHTFLTAWKKFALRTAVTLKPHRGHVCETVIPPPPTQGQFDHARPTDTDRLAALVDAFLDEIREPVRGDNRTFVESAIREARLFVWRNPDIVSMAVATGFTRHGVRIGYVYTPPEHRSRGYASNLTAALTRRLLSEGLRFCFLFTVTTNPIPNRIYATIGYRPLADYLLANFL